MARYEARHAAESSQGRHRSGEPKRRGHRVARRVVGTVAGVAVVAGLAYGAGLYYFQDHFLPNTTVNGRDVSLMSEGEVASQIGSSTDGYTSTIKTGDFSYTVSGSDIDLRTDGATAASDALAQVDLTRWPLLALEGSSLSVHEGVSFDEQKLEDAVGSAVDAYNEQATQPQDAGWSVDKDTGTFSVTPDEAGTAVDRDAVVKAAVAGVDGLSTDTTCDDSAEVRPTRTSDDPTLTAAVDKANEIASSSISLTYDGKVKAKVSRQQLAQWVSIGDDLSVGVDKDAVASYVANTVAPTVNTEDDDNTYTVSKASLTGELASTAEEGGGTLEVPVTTKAKPKKAEKTETDSKGQDADGTGSSGSGKGSSLASSLGSYIDVDLGNQRATYYDAGGGVLWQSSIVSGNESEGRSTPTGTYQINDKETNQTLVGADENGDGEPDYKSHVNYWMPFIGNSVGLHDATWRGTFGGSVYESSGSHGCVNLPYGKAAELYGMVPVGTTVYVHH